MRDEPTDLLGLGRGDSVGRYLILERLGAGGLGTVYRAYDPDLDRAVALKEIHGLSDDAAGQRATALREAQAMARLTHPNVVGVFDVLVDDGRFFIAMELVEGENLASWLETPRSIDAILDVFVDCARGLAAAHDANLCHRDCKPSNLLVGRDGVGKVADFGLASPAVGTVGDDARARDRMAVVDLTHPLSGRGPVPGTAAYVAPEVSATRRADARSDQYSFCVALFEAIVGRRPATGDHRAAPRPLRRLLARGLDPDPEHRFRDMHAVGRALLRVRTRARRLAAWAGAFTITGGALAALALPATESPCSQFSGRWSGVWDSARKQEIGRTLAAAGVRNADRVTDRFTATLDEYTEAWTRAHTQACEAAVVRNDQSVQLYQARALCYEQRWEQVRALLDVVGQADADMTVALSEPERALGSLQPCGTGAALLLQVPLPNEHAAQDVRLIRSRIADATALGWAGRARASLETARAASTEAEELGYAPLMAEAQLREGLSLIATGEYEDALDTLARAHWSAQAQRHDRIAADAAIAVVAVLGTYLEQVEPALDWSQQASAAVQRLGPPGEEAFHLANALGTLSQGRGELEESVRHYERALDLGRRLTDIDPAKTAMVLQNLGTALELLGRWDDARARYDEALEQFQRELGDDHPRVALVLHNLAVFHHTQGRDADALASAQRALQIKRTALPAPHLSVAKTLQVVGPILLSMGRADEAREAGMSAAQIVEDSVGSEHPEMGVAWTNLGAVAQRQGEFEEARDLYTRALEIFERTYGDDHPLAFETRIHRASLWADEGSLDGALAEYRSVRKALDGLGVGGRFAALETDIRIGRVLTDLGRWDEAREQLTAAVANTRTQLSADHPLHAKAAAGLTELEDRQARN